MKKVVLILKILAALIAVLIFYYLISTKLDRNRIFAFCLDGDVKGAMEVLKASDNKILFPTDWILKGKFEKRFKDTLDESGYMEERQSRINGLLSIYCNYWRVAVLDNSKNYDTILIQNVTKYLIDNYSPAHGVNLIPDSLNVYTKKYVESFGYHTAGFGKTGRFYDLLVWKSETEKKYPVHLGNEEVNTKVIVASDFITLGWEEYATADRAHPGGWAEM